jgi:hypothetical protein
MHAPTVFRLDALTDRLHALPVRRTRPSLPVLDEAHPEAAIGSRIDIGVREIEVDAIRGTAVGGETLRGPDFKPVGDLRTYAWHTRWQRLEKAFDRNIVLPPVDVLEVGGEYCVVDGHNRVAMAREQKVAYLDANVTSVHWPGGPQSAWRAGELAGVFAVGAQQRAAASREWRGSASGLLADVTAWRIATAADCRACF